MQPKQYYVRIVFEDGRTKTEEFGNELMANSCYYSYINLQYDLGIKAIYRGKHGDMPEDMAQSLINRVRQNRPVQVIGGVR